MAKKIEAFWVDATADDVLRVMKGETVEARFRDEKNEGWFITQLAGWTARKFPWLSTYDYHHWAHCQVYREPSWYANKPDPGPGYRLLGKFPDEELKPGDDYFCHASETWRASSNAKDGQPQLKKTWYRRRIEAVEPKFAAGQTVRVIGPKTDPAWHWGKEMDCHIGFVGVIRNSPLEDGSLRFYNLEGVGIWCFREDYLEAVEPDRGIALSVGDH